MAEVVLGIGSSHGPMLNTDPANWDARSVADRQNKRLFFAGAEYTYEELLAERGDGFASQMGIDVWQEQHRACRSAIDELAAVIDDVRPDVAIILSADHKEIFGDDNLPSLLVYTGADVDHVPFTPEQLAKMPAGLAQAEIHNVPETPLKQPCAPGLATHLLDVIREEGFEVSISRQLPPGRRENRSIPHGWGFVYRHLMKDKVIPNVPFMVNTFYPPNQPTARRCVDLGFALREAVESWDDDSKVALVASGGLSHFVIEEDLDQHVIDSMTSTDLDAMRALPTERLQSGTSEIRNWLAVAGAMADTGKPMNLVDYTPCYRSEAGTGCAMAFGHWTK